MAANTTNFVLTNLKNVYVLTTTIHSSSSKEKMKWHFLVRKEESLYCDLFTNKPITILECSKIVIGVLGEYAKYYDIHIEKITHINEFTNRFKGMDIESFAALSEFSMFINIMSNMVDLNKNQVIFET